MVDIKEIISARAISGEDAVIEVIIADINPIMTTSILTQLSDRIPLQAYNIDHLKRVRRVQNKVGSPDVEFKDEGDGSISKYNFRLQVLLCPSRLFQSMLNEVRSIMGISLNQVLITETIKVCKFAPETRAEFDAWNVLWPTTYHPNQLCRERERGTHNEDELPLIAQYLNLVQADGEACKQLATEYNAGLSLPLPDPATLLDTFAGAVLVNPITHQVLASSYDYYLLA